MLRGIASRWRPVVYFILLSCLKKNTCLNHFDLYENRKTSAEVQTGRDEPVTSGSAGRGGGVKGHIQEIFPTRNGQSRHRTDAAPFVGVRKYRMCGGGGSY